MKNLSRSLLALCLLGNFVNDTFALVPGTLDTTFNAGGVQPGTVSTNVDNSTASCVGYAVKLQQDGKIVVSGSVGDATTKFAVARFTTNGILDTSFGGPLEPGTFSNTIDNNVGLSSVAFDEAIQQDNKIIAAGGMADAAFGSNKFALARYTANGALDTTFGGILQPGTTSTTIENSSDSQGFGVALQQDGKIVVTGYVNTGMTIDLALARFKTNGSLDTSFGGVLQPGTTSVAVGSFALGNAVAIQQDGKIVVAGIVFIGSGIEFLVARFNTNGTLDATFNPAGTPPGTKTTKINNETGDNEGQAVVIQSDGKIVVAGFARLATFEYRFAVARFNTNGTLDTSFNPGGVQPGTVITTVENATMTNVGQSVDLQIQGGKIVVAGYATIDGVDRFAVAQFNSNGMLDTAFNPTGVQPGTTSTTIDNNLIQNRGLSVTIQPDGKIVVSGTTVAVGSTTRIAVARFNGDIITPTPVVPTNNACALRLIEKYGSRLFAQQSISSQSVPVVVT